MSASLQSQLNRVKLHTEIALLKLKLHWLYELEGICPSAPVQKGTNKSKGFFFKLSTVPGEKEQKCAGSVFPRGGALRKDVRDGELCKTLCWCCLRLLFPPLGSLRSALPWQGSPAQQPEPGLRALRRGHRSSRAAVCCLSLLLWAASHSPRCQYVRLKIILFIRVPALELLSQTRELSLGNISLSPNGTFYIFCLEAETFSGQLSVPWGQLFVATKHPKIAHTCFLSASCRTKSPASHLSCWSSGSHMEEGTSPSVTSKGKKKEKSPPKTSYVCGERRIWEQWIWGRIWTCVTQTWGASVCAQPAAGVLGPPRSEF